MKVKKGDVFRADPSWETDLGLGVVTKTWTLLNGEQGFNIEFKGYEIRGPFHTNEIGVIIRPLTKLEKALK